MLIGLLFLAAAPSTLPALTIESWGDGAAAPFSLSMTTRSGSPLLLEMTAHGSDRLPAPAVLTIWTSFVTAEYALPASSQVRIDLTPFSTPGIYELTAELAVGDDSWQRTLQIGFSEFIWGRDNFRFSNIRSRYSSVHPYSGVLFPWITARFGPRPLAERIALLEYAYRVIGGSAGRCYAFTGSQVRYIRSPELLPSYYDSVYDIRQTHRTIGQEMNLLQNDIMYDVFVLGGRSLQGPQRFGELREEIDSILDRIGKGELVPVGYVTPERHHSLLVYGFIRDPAADRITLVTANNWGVEHDENRLSEAVVLLEVDLAADFSRPAADDSPAVGRVQWIDPPNSSYREAEHLFAVPVQQEYSFAPDILDMFVAERFDELAAEGKAVLIAEEIEDVMLSDAEGLQTGRTGRKELGELELVTCRHIQDTHVFTLPAEREYTLKIEGDPTGDAGSSDSASSDSGEAGESRVYLLTFREGQVQAAAFERIVFDASGTIRYRISPDVPAGMDLLTDEADPSDSADEADVPTDQEETPSY